MSLQSYYDSLPDRELFCCPGISRSFECERGRRHLVAFHIEGGCAQWSDNSLEIDELDDDAREDYIARGGCSFGCRPSRHTALIRYAEHQDLPF